MGDFSNDEVKNLAGATSSNKAEDPTGQFPTAEHVKKENINKQPTLNCFLFHQ